MRKLLAVIHRLADLGNTVVVIEHNLEVIKTADWVIDLGPEAGMAGGDLVAEGTPEQIVKDRRSHTGKFLEPVLAASPRGNLSVGLARNRRWQSPLGKTRFAVEGIDRIKSARTSETNGEQWQQSSEEGSSQRFHRPFENCGHRIARHQVDGQVKAPWETDGRKWHTRDRTASNGRPARWDGRILEQIVDRIEELAAVRDRICTD